VIAALCIVSYALVGTAGVLLLRSSMRGTTEHSGAAQAHELMREPRFVAGVAPYALSFGTWLLALRRYEVVQVFPIFVGAGTGAVVLGGHIVLGEELSLTMTCGAISVLVGIVLLMR
jgi:multidrug transporter EmrE-like cation transporter